MKLQTILIRSLLPLALLAGCDATTAEPPDEVLASEQDELRGTVNYADDCNAGQRTFLDRVMLHGRVASASPAFQACLAAAIDGTTLTVPTLGSNVPLYRECKGDPFHGKSNAAKLAGVMQMVQSDNQVTMQCSGGSGNASASLGTHMHSGPEKFSWGGWLASVVGQLTQQVCGTPGAPGSGCRFRAYPWPYSQAAAISWHEAAHTHGYTHGANDQAAAKVACGYENDATWHFQSNTMPYLIGWCMSAVIEQSAATCGGGDLALNCQGDAMRVVDTFGGTTCSCVNDPRISVLGVGNTSQSLFVKNAFSEAWSAVPNSAGVRDVTRMNDGTLLGVGSTNSALWTRATLTSPWVSVPNSAGVRSVAVMKNGTILGVGDTNFALWTRATLTSPWVSVPNSAGVRDVAVMPDGTILGVGNTNFALWTRASLNAPWVSVPNSVGVQAVDVMSNGTIVGVGNTSFSLWTRKSLGAPWVSVPSSNGVSSVAFIPTVPRGKAPAGSLDSANVRGVSGWAVDSDHPDQPVTVHVYVNGTFAAAGVADQFRGNLGHHGFNVPVDFMSRGYGAHQVAVYAIDPDGRANTHVAGSPRTVNVTSTPAHGWIDAADADAISGWAEDLDYDGPVNVHLYIDGQGVDSTWADIYRSDVGSHGYSFDPPALGPGPHRVEVYVIGVDPLGNPTGENPLLSGSPATYYEVDFWKPGNNGTASCDVFCEGAVWGEVGGCITGVRSDTGERLACDAAPGLIDGQLACGCERGFIKPGNNGTVSCDVFCDGAVWGPRGRCVGAERSDTGERLTCGEAPGFLGGHQLVCQCVPKIILE